MAAAVRAPRLALLVLLGASLCLLGTSFIWTLGARRSSRQRPTRQCLDDRTISLLQQDAASPLFAAQPDRVLDLLQQKVLQKSGWPRGGGALYGAATATERELQQQPGPSAVRVESRRAAVQPVQQAAAQQQRAPVPAGVTSHTRASACNALQAPDSHDCRRRCPIGLVAVSGVRDLPLPLVAPHLWSHTALCAASALQAAAVTGVSPARITSRLTQALQKLERALLDVAQSYSAGPAAQRSAQEAVARAVSNVAAGGACSAGKDPAEPPSGGATPARRLRAAAGAAGREGGGPGKAEVGDCCRMSPRLISDASLAPASFRASPLMQEDSHVQRQTCKALQDNFDRQRAVYDGTIATLQSKLERQQGSVAVELRRGAERAEELAKQVIHAQYIHHRV
ncbi:hypothetical protein JKP88DRAFT_251506 [Tribonema minus]|uniref:Uncharacterized protein n=1 Tax=Tribonema minus TaxID=303371 RepID=A0A835ZFX6_9STRA|nr:hypothetical protein JKP88DRAFT_251506 [Tribonema minus]